MVGVESLIALAVRHRYILVAVAAVLLTPGVLAAQVEWVGEEMVVITILTTLATLVVTAVVAAELEDRHTRLVIPVPVVTAFRAS